MKKKLLFIVPGIIIIVVIITGVWLYTGSMTSAKEKVFRKTPLPVAVVDRHFINGKEFFTRFDIAKSLLKSDKTYNEQEVRRQILGQLINTQKLLSVAIDRNVSVSEEEIDKEYQVFVRNFAQGDEQKFRDVLQQTYQLTPEEFKQKVLAPDLLMAALTVWHNKQESLNQEAFAKQKEIKAKLDAGQPFGEVAKAFSDDESTKELNGDTGFVLATDLLPEFQNELRGMKLNDQKEITSRFGMHTVKVIELDPANENRYHLQQIFVKQDGFEQWFASQIEKVKTYTLVKF